MPPQVIADSDDEEDAFVMSPVKCAPNNGVASRPSPATPIIGLTTMPEPNHVMVSSNQTLDPPHTNSTDSTDDLFFQHIYNKHNDAALRQLAIQNNATTSAKMGQPSSRPYREESSSDREKAKVKTKAKANVAEDAPSSLTDPGHPSKHHNGKSKDRDTSDITNVTTPGRSLERVNFDPYMVPDSSPERPSGPRTKRVKTKSKTEKAPIKTPKGTDRPSSVDPSSADLPSSFKKMLQAPVSSLTHVTETPTTRSDATIIIPRTSSRSLIPFDSEHSSKRRGFTDDLSHISETPPHGEVIFVPDTATSGSSSTGNNKMGANISNTGFYIQPTSMTASQMKEYQSVDPSPHHYGQSADDGTPRLPRLVATSNEMIERSSGDLSTVACSTPSRFQSTDPRVIIPESQTVASLPVGDAVGQSSSPKISSVTIQKKTKIVLKKRTVAASPTARPETRRTQDDVIMVNSSPDVISNPNETANTGYSNSNTGGAATTSQDLGEMAPELRSARGKKRQSIESEDELSACLHNRSDSNPRPTKRRSLPSNMPPDDENSDATAALNDTSTIATATPPKGQKKRGRKKKEPVAVADTNMTGMGSIDLGQVVDTKPKKKRGRPRKSDVETPQVAALTATAPPSPPAKVVNSKPDVGPELSDDEAIPSPTKADNVLKETTPNIKADNSKTDIQDGQNEDDGGNVKEKEKGKGKKAASAVPASKYRVGLSRNARIQPLLKIIRK